MVYSILLSKIKTMIYTEISLEELNRTSKGTMIEHLGIEYLEMKDGYAKAKMPMLLEGPFLATSISFIFPSLLSGVSPSKMS